MSSARYARSTSVPPTSRGRYAASPFRDRATSTPPLAQSHYSDFDYKVINYMAKLTCQDDIKQYVSSASTIRYRQDSAQQVLTMLQESRGTGSISPGQLQEQVQLLRRHQAHGGLSLPRHQPGQPPPPGLIRCDVMISRLYIPGFSLLLKNTKVTSNNKTSQKA